MRIAAICLGFVFDALLGDPHGLWHPICAIGGLISKTEKLLRRVFPANPAGERLAGAVLWFFVCAASFGVPCALLWGAAQINEWLAFALETLFCYQIFARRALRDESHKVYARLVAGDLDGARRAVSYIVGRDTQDLDAAGVTRGAVETVAENASDGVVAPMLFLFLGGAPLGFFYKAVNTLDSMVGYRNEKYRDFGWFSAKMDDICNWIPARLCALCMITAARVLGQDSPNALRVWRRDRRRHASPNSAQTESACAGALHVQLAGNAVYFGKTHEKPTLGDADRPIEPADIDRACELMTAASVLALLLLAAVALAAQLPR